VIYRNIPAGAVCFELNYIAWINVQLYRLCQSKCHLLICSCTQYDKTGNCAGKGEFACGR